MLEMNDKTNEIFTKAMNDADKAIAAYRKSARNLERLAWTLFAVSSAALLGVVVLTLLAMH